MNDKILLYFKPLVVMSRVGGYLLFSVYQTGSHDIDRPWIQSPKRGYHLTICDRRGAKDSRTYHCYVLKMLLTGQYFIVSDHGPR